MRRKLQTFPNFTFNSFWKATSRARIVTHKSAFFTRFCFSIAKVYWKFFHAPPTVYWGPYHFQAKWIHFEPSKVLISTVSHDEPWIKNISCIWWWRLHPRAKRIWNIPWVSDAREPTIFGFNWGMVNERENCHFCFHPSASEPFNITAVKLNSLQRHFPSFSVLGRLFFLASTICYWIASISAFNSS